MKQNSSTTFLKVFMVAVTATIIAVAALAWAWAWVWPRARPPRSPCPGDAVGTSAAQRSHRDPGGPAPARALTPDPTKPVTVPTAKNPSKGDKTELDTKLFNETLKLLRDQFYGDLPQGEDLTYEALRGFVNQLGDPHTAFLDPEQAAQFNSDIQGQFEGIGARVDKAENGGVEIKYLFAEQPAEKAGVRVGDMIMAVDAKDLTQLDLNEASPDSRPT